MANENETSNGAPEEAFVPLPIVYEEAPGNFANHFTIQFDAHEFHLSFFEVHPPLVLGTQEERMEKLKALSGIHARNVGHIIVSASRMPTFARAILTNVMNNAPEAVDGLRAMLMGEEEME